MPSFKLPHQLGGSGASQLHRVLFHIERGADVACWSRHDKVLGAPTPLWYIWHGYMPPHYGKVPWYSMAHYGEVLWYSMARTPEQLRSSHSTTNYRRRSHRSPPFLCYAPIQPQLWAPLKIQTTPYNAANADPIDTKHQFAKLALSDICISQEGHSSSVISLLSLNCYVSRMMLNWRKTDGDTLHN